MEPIFKQVNTTVSPNSARPPFVSVIIPVYNDPTGLADTLESISAQDYSRNKWEVIVIDNNSTDHTILTAKSFKGAIPSLKIEKELKQSSYAARNVGIQHAKGQILAFIDSDITVGSDWISTGVSDMEKSKADYVGCRVDIYSAQSAPNFWEKYNQKLGFPIRKYMEKYGFAGAGNIFVKIKVFEKIGIFDRRLQSTGDLEFGNRVRDAKFKMYYSDHNIMKHPARSTLKSFLKKSVRVSKGHIDLKVYYPERYGTLNLFEILLQFIPKIISTSAFRSSSTNDKILLFLFSMIIQIVGTTTRLWQYFQIKTGKIHRETL